MDPRRRGRGVVGATPEMLTRLGLIVVRRPGLAPPGTLTTPDSVARSLDVDALAEPYDILYL